MGYFNEVCGICIQKILNSSKRIIGQKIDIRILPKQILIRIFEQFFEP